LFSCIAGDGERGTSFLNLLSGRLFLHRHVIGFDVFGLYAPVTASAKADLIVRKVRPFSVEEMRRASKAICWARTSSLLLPKIG
jgi:hypothetical protein